MEQKRLDEIKANVNEAHERMHHTMNNDHVGKQSGVYAQICGRALVDLGMLLAEVEWLRAENAAMKADMKAMVNHAAAYGGIRLCISCDKDPDDCEYCTHESMDYICPWEWRAPQ